MDLLRVIVLAVVQGLTEFLPISSDGHLVVTDALFEAATGRKAENLLALEIVLHAGTLAAVLVAFRRQIARLLTADRRVIGLIIAGSVPAAIFGLYMKKQHRELLENPLLAGLGLIATGLVLLWGARRAKAMTGGSEQAASDFGTATAAKSYTELDYGGALVVGTFQAAAILPGVSRSGLTISSGLRLANLRPVDAADFSFLLSIPAVGGAVLLQGLEFARGGATLAMPVGELAFGAVVSFVVGLVALRWLLAWLQRGRLHYFAGWCLPLGAAVTIWQLVTTGAIVP